MLTSSALLVAELAVVAGLSRAEGSAGDSDSRESCPRAGRLVAMRLTASVVMLRSVFFIRKWWCWSVLGAFAETYFSGFYSRCKDWEESFLREVEGAEVGGFF